MKFRRKNETEVRKSEWLTKTKRAYFLTTIAIYLLIFGVGFLFLTAVLTVLQMHPLVNLLLAIVLLLADIWITHYVINVLWNDRWIHKSALKE